ncbi:MAG: hypothetical protein AABY99_09375 [Pseudomonadota bacterium]
MSNHSGAGIHLRRKFALLLRLRAARDHRFKLRDLLGLWRLYSNTTSLPSYGLALNICFLQFRFLRDHFPFAFRALKGSD